MKWIQSIFTTVVQGLLRTLEQRFDRRFAEIEQRTAGLEQRIDRAEWDWADLKRLHPELVKDFPPR